MRQSHRTYDSFISNTAEIPSCAFFLEFLTVFGLCLLLAPLSLCFVPGMLTCVCDPPRHLTIKSVSTDAVMSHIHTSCNQEKSQRWGFMESLNVQMWTVKYLILFMH